MRKSSLKGKPNSGESMPGGLELITFIFKSQIKLGFCLLVINCIQGIETLHLEWDAEVTYPTMSGRAYESGQRDTLENNQVWPPREGHHGLQLAHTPGGTTDIHG